MSAVKPTADDFFEARTWLEERPYVQVCPGHMNEAIEQLAKLIAASYRAGYQTAWDESS